jgi:NADPH-dependent 2,4-dienoyl-CoA reductase/sulfur reductase-like enzyme
MAGLGVSPTEDDTDHYSSRYAHCDVLVIGAGVAGLSAALAAAKTGARVIICDEQPEVGGALHYDKSVTIDGLDGFSLGAGTAANLAKMENVTVLPRTTAFGYYAQNFVGLNERVTEHLAKPDKKLPRERLWQVRAKRVIIATGAIERHMVFANNDRPGIMLASAARTFLNHFGVAVGKKVGVYTANDSAYEAAFDLKRAGITIAAIVDSREQPGEAVLAEARPSASRFWLVMASSIPVASCGFLPCRLPAMAAAASARSPSMRCWCRPDGRLRCTCSRSRAARWPMTSKASASCPVPMRRIACPSAPATAPTTFRRPSRNRSRPAS